MNNYQNNIEKAIQNVLSKVKHPERFKPVQTLSVEASGPVLPKISGKGPSEDLPPDTEKPRGKEASVPSVPPEQTVEDDVVTDKRKSVFSKPSQMGVKVSLEALPEAEIDPDAVFYEAEDLFTPIPLDEEEEDVEPPIIEDIYEAPFNLFEGFVETELDILLSRYVDLCHCSQCRADIVAMALQQLPAFYVTGTRSMFTAKNMIYTKYTQKIIDAVTKSIHMVYKRPRSSCKRIKQVLWIKPEIEEVQEMTPESGLLFEDVYDHEVEVSFSDEVSDIIEALEASAPEEEAQLMLPVTSAKVKKAYQEPTEDTDAEERSESPDDPVEELPLEQATMQLIDDWDND